MRVEEYVELGCWGDVAFANGSTHDHYFLDFLFQLWICQEHYCQIGQRAGVNPYNFALIGVDLLEYFLKTLLPLGFFRRRRQLDSPKSIAAMHMLGQFHLSLDELVGARNNRHIAPSNIVQNIKCILSGIVEVGIAGRCRYSQEVYPWGMGCVYYCECVVETRVAVEPDCLGFCLLHCLDYKIDKISSCIKSYS